MLNWGNFMAVDLAVVGLGYVGLPLVFEAVHAGMSVRGYDVNRGVVDGLNRGVSHIDYLSDEQIADLVSRGSPRRPTRECWPRPSTSSSVSPRRSARTADRTSGRCVPR